MGLTAADTINELEWQNVAQPYPVFIPAKIPNIFNILPLPNQLTLVGSNVTLT